MMHILRTVDDDTKARTLLLLWRVWHHHNDIVHDKGRPTIMRSAKFLKSYVVALNVVVWGRQGGASDKGKEKIEEGVTASLNPEGGGVHLSSGQRGWTPLSVGWAKLNTDVEFCIDTGKVRIGMVVRDIEWQSPVVSMLNHIDSTEEAEVVACLEGLRLTQKWIGLPTCVETDCKQLVQALEKEEPTRSSWAGLIGELKRRADSYRDASLLMYVGRLTRLFMAYPIGDATSAV
jgi:hypothetical protein